MYQFPPPGHIKPKIRKDHCGCLSTRLWDWHVATSFDIEETIEFILKKQETGETKTTTTHQKGADDNDDDGTGLDVDGDT